MSDKDKWGGFEGRFSRLVFDHYGEKLKALPDDKRAAVIESLRERYREYENDPEVENENQVVSFFEKWGASTNRLRDDNDRILEEALKDQNPDKAQEAWDRLQQERGRDQGQEREPER